MHELMFLDIDPGEIERKGATRKRFEPEITFNRAIVLVSVCMSQARTRRVAERR